jgi:hydrophobic/amphiphilic exporter-1 (mainly G- bacteria), HAE1 family
MRIQEFFVARPVTVIMISLAAMLFGAIALAEMEIDLLPRMRYPEISVITLYRGAPPAEIESLVSRPVEEALSSVPGVKRVRSESIEGASMVVASFEWGTDMDFAAMRVRERADLVRGALPQDAEKSLIARFDPNSLPVMGIAVTAPGGIEGLRDEVEQRIKPRFERIDGVGSARISGGRVREIQVQVDMARLYAHRLSILDVAERVKMSNQNFPAGTAQRGAKEYLVRTMGEFRGPADISGVMVKADGHGRPVYVRDLAAVEDSFKDRTSLSGFDGRESLGIALIKEAGRNTVAVCDEAARVVCELNEQYRGRIELAVSYDASIFIRSAVSNVTGSAVLGALITFALVFVFLKRLRVSFIIISVMPVSVMATLFLMHLRGVSLNMMSLGGLALGVGEVLDKGIVVLDAIESRRASGSPAIDACVEGAGEIAGAQLASTLTSVVVFAPIMFLRGIAGEVFGDLAFTVSASLLVSWCASVSMVPALYALSERAGEFSQFRLPGHEWFKTAGEWTDSLLSRIDGLYGQCIGATIGRFRAVLAVSAASVLIGALAFSVIDTALLPAADSGAVTLRMTGRRGAPLDETREIMMRLDAYAAGKPYTAHRVIDAGFNPDEVSEYFGRERSRSTGELMVILSDDRALSTREAARDLMRGFTPPAGAKLEAYTDEREFAGFAGMGGGGAMIDVTGDDFESLERAAREVLARAREEEALGNARMSTERERPEVKLRFDRAKLATFGLTVRQAAESVRAALMGEGAGMLYQDDSQADITVRLRERDRREVRDLPRIPVRARDDAIVPLDSFAAVEMQSGFNKIIRKNQRRCISIEADAAPGKGASAVIEALAGAAARAALPAGTNAGISEEALEVRASLAELAGSLALSVILIYMILAAQMESLTRPLLVMLAVPLAVSGVAAALLLTGNSVNIISVIGMVMLSGTVVSGAIILLEYIGIYRTQGLPARDAAVRACRERLRPILMTSLTTILGLLPLAAGIGRGSEMQTPLAVTVIGGMLASTALTLVALPVFYCKGAHDGEIDAA